MDCDNDELTFKAREQQKSLGEAANIICQRPKPQIPEQTIDKNTTSNCLNVSEAQAKSTKQSKSKKSS